MKPKCAFESQRMEAEEQLTKKKVCWLLPYFCEKGARCEVCVKVALGSFACPGCIKSNTSGP